MMNRITFILFLFLTALIIYSCSSSNPKVEATKVDVMETYADPFEDLNNLANKIIEGGGVAAVGQGISSRQDLAREKAITNAQGALAQIFNTKVQRLNKNFQEEIGSTNDSEINEAFSTVTKTLTSQLLVGAFVKETKYLRNKETGQISAGVVIAIDPKTINQSILDELKTKSPKLYERFRATQAFEELKKEMEEYEKQQQQK